MRLFLMRHGEAEPQAARDADRALNEAGRRAVQRKLVFLEPVESFYCSPYKRAQQTASIIQSTVQAKPVTDPRLTPDQPVAKVLELLQSLDTGSCLIVGHNPLLSQLASVLVGEFNGVVLPTAGLVYLRADDCYPGGAELKWIK